MSQTDHSRPVEALTALGLTDLEATAYTYLVGSSPATAYKIARDIGKPVANTYKAVESLFRKGAVMIDETENRLCRAVEPEIFLEGLKSTYLASQEAAKDSLSQFSLSDGEERIYSLSTPEQVFERFHAMCEGAASIILVDAFPGTAQMVRPWLEEAAARGVTVVVQVYKQLEIEGAETIAMPKAEQMLTRWKGDWLIAVVDGAEYLQAFFSDDLSSVHVANWSGSAFLALPQHNFLANTFRQALIERDLEKGSSVSQIKSQSRRTEEWATLGKRGYENLRERFGG